MSDEVIRLNGKYGFAMVAVKSSFLDERGADQIIISSPSFQEKIKTLILRSEDVHHRMEGSKIELINLSQAELSLLHIVETSRYKLGMKDMNVQIIGAGQGFTGAMVIEDSIFSISIEKCIFLVFGCHAMNCKGASSHSMNCVCALTIGDAPFINCSTCLINYKDTAVNMVANVSSVILTTGDEYPPYGIFSATDYADAADSDEQQTAAIVVSSNKATGGPRVINIKNCTFYVIRTNRAAKLPHLPTSESNPPIKIS